LPPYADADTIITAPPTSLLPAAGPEPVEAHPWLWRLTGAGIALADLLLLAGLIAGIRIDFLAWH
jgi:hypothetical protein